MTTSGTACNDHVVVDGVEVKPDQHQQLEHSLATTFVKWMDCTIPGERTQLWQSMFEIARELRRLDG